MGLGPSLVGGVVGAAIGVAVQFVLETAFRIQAPWAAVAIGLLTGLGVRQATKARFPQPSYARGALSGLLALAAIVVSPQVIKASLQRQDSSLVAKPKLAAAPAEEDVAEEAGEAVAAAPVQPLEPAAGELRGGDAAPLLRRPEQQDLWQFAYMAVGAFLAYEFGRGSGPATAAPHQPPQDDQPIATDPSN